MTAVTNCGIYDYNGAAFCKECQSAYHFETNNSSVKICVPDNQFYYYQSPSEGMTSTVQYNLISTDSTKTFLANCADYDFRRQECVSCRNGFYLYKKNCCAAAKYGDICEKTIATDFPDCTSVAYDTQLKQVQCIACSTKQLNMGHCCLATEYWNGTACAAKMANCSNYDQVYDYCYTCADGYYNHIEYNLCIPILSYFNNSAVAVMTPTNVKNGYNVDYVFCDVYILSINQCLKCSKDYILNGDRKTCVYFRDELDNCNKLNQKTKQCIECVSGYYMTNGVCCKSASTAQYFEPTTDFKCKSVTAPLANC